MNNVQRGTKTTMFGSHLTEIMIDSKNDLGCNSKFFNIKIPEKCLNFQQILTVNS